MSCSKSSLQFPHSRLHTWEVQKTKLYPSPKLNRLSGADQFITDTCITCRNWTRRVVSKGQVGPRKSRPGSDSVRVTALLYLYLLLSVSESDSNQLRHAQGILQSIQFMQTTVDWNRQSGGHDCLLVLACTGSDTISESRNSLLVHLDCCHKQQNAGASCVPLQNAKASAGGRGTPGSQQSHGCQWKLNSRVPLMVEIILPVKAKMVRGRQPHCQSRFFFTREDLGVLQYCL